MKKKAIESSEKDSHCLTKMTKLPLGYKSSAEKELTVSAIRSLSGISKKFSEMKS